MESKKSTSAHNVQHTIEKIVLNIVSKLLTIPLFILSYRILPDLELPYYIDKIILYLIIFVFTLFILKYFRKIILPVFIFMLAFLTLGSFTGKYSFKSLYKDYAAMIYSIIYDPVPTELNTQKYLSFPNQHQIKKAVNFTSPIVRNFALYSINKHFKDKQKGSAYRVTIQCFSIFKEINSRWNYVNDPKSRDYYAQASESIMYLSGDCDDHSTLMAACIKSVGGTPRLILTTKHIYPELYVGNIHDMEHINLLIHNELFIQEAKGKKLFYHVDTDGKVWINLDYTAHYPGGEFLSEKVLGILIL